VGRNLGSNSYCNTSSSIDEQVGQPSWKHKGLTLQS
jgi:hypothetical protein